MRRSLQKLFCLCIVLAMVLSMVPAADVSAAAGTAWSGGAFSKSGEYYLTGDITISEAITLNSSREVTLDLNGHTITVAAGVRAFYLNGGKLTIKDSGEGGTIQASNTEFSGRGGIIYVKGSAAVLTLESGTITGGSATERGGNIYVESGMFNMTGGTISGGKVGDRGGNIASTGKVNISGGIITGGQATSYGGNILTTGANCYVNLSGTAQITDGVSKNGGNIMLMYSNLNISGGTISGGVATSYGANVHTYGTESSHCSFTMSGGLIGNAGAAAAVSSIYLTGPAANKCLVNISGGTIQGRVIANATGSITLSGAPVIENLYLNAGNLVTPSGLTAGADISVSVASGYTGISGLVTNASQYRPYFSSYTAG